MLGEAKAYTSEYQFSSAFKKAIDSILDTYKKFRGELGLYLHEDFLDKDMDAVAEGILENTLPNVEVELVSLILYSETKAISGTNEYEIKEQIKNIIKNRYRAFDNEKIPIKDNQILHRITYIVFPIWKFEELATEFQEMF